MNGDGMAGKVPDGALPLFIGGGPTHEVRTEDKLVYTMSYEKEEDERSEINRDHRRW